MNKENILGIDVTVTDYDSLKKSVEKDIKNNKKSFIVAINPEKILKARKDESLKELLNNADYQIPDGIGAVYASKLKGYKIFLYGAKKEVIKEAKQKLEEKYKNIKIVGAIDGYEIDNDKIIKAINKSKADIIFVALGSPKQENWIVANKDKVCVKIFQGVGGSFDVISGNIKRAPKWMQNLGLEWLYRLIKEPKRIFRQIKLIKFLGLVIFNFNSQNLND